MSLSDLSKKFLRAAFGEKAAQSWVVCWKFDKDDKARNIREGRAKNMRPAADEAVFFSVGLPVEDRRGADNAGSIHALVVDDVGVKLDRAMVDMFAPLEPSAVVESSPGSFQYMWFCPEGMTVEEHEALWAGKDALLGKSDGCDAMRVFRLPQGVNGKRKDATKTAFAVRAVSGPGKVYGKAELLAAFEAPVAVKKKTGKGQEAPSVEAVAALLRGPLKNDWDGEDNSGKRKRWIDTGMAIKGSLPHNEDEAFALFVEYSGEHEDADLVEVWRGLDPNRIGWGWLEIAAKAVDGGAAEMADAAFDDGADLFGEPVEGGKLTIKDFWAFMPKGTFICLRDGSMWSDKAAVNNALEPTPGVNGKGKPILIPAADVLQRTRQVHQMSWMPGMDQIVRDFMVPANGGAMRVQKGHTIYNKYIPPEVQPGVAERAQFWVEWVKKLYPREWQHILLWMAHRVQRPGEKINHAMVLGGEQGIGKDFILRPLVVGVGDHNLQSISPPELLGQFNGYVQGVVLIINEIHNLGDGLNPYRFYEKTKTLIAAPPMVLRVNEKYLGEYYIPNVVGVVMTTNHKLDGLYIDENDRRHFIAWSGLRTSDVPREGWEMMWQRMDDHVWDCVAYLREMDLSKFDPKAPPEKTATWHDIVNAGNVDAQDEEIAEVLGLMGNPDAFTRKDFAAKASDRLQEWIEKASKPFANKLDAQGYKKAINHGDASGRYKINGRRETIYVRNDLPRDEQNKAVKKLIGVKESRS